MSQHEVRMPSLGEGVNEATLVRWLKQTGDQVQLDEPLFEVSTDKVDTEIAAPESGYLAETLAQEGQTVQVDQVLARISMSQTNAQPAPKASPPPVEAPKAVPATQPAAPTQLAQQPKLKSESTTSSQSKKSSPLVRKIAKERGIDLSEVQGTGLHGRVTKKDLDHYLKGYSRQAATTYAAGSDQRPAVASAQTAGTAADVPRNVPAAAQERLETTFENDKEYLDGVEVERQTMSQMRSLIAAHMVRSVATSPHVTTVFEIDLSKVVAIRERCKGQVWQNQQIKLTYTPFLIHAAVTALKAHPIVNSSVDGQDILYKKDINIGCAVAIESGLIVPVIKKAQDLSLGGIVAKLDDLVNRARTKKLKPDDVRGGTFSVTNPGGYGCITSNPIINQPQVAILGIGAIVKRAVVIEDAIAIRPMMMASLTFDHRVIDGEGGANYLASFKNILETYEQTP